MALRLLGDLTGSRVLDIGTNEGYVAALLQERGGHVTGVDRYASVLRLARDLVPESVFVAARAEQLPFTGSAYDIVCALDTLEHVDDIRSALMEISRVLRPGGLFILTVPNKHLDFLDHENWKWLRGIRNLKRAREGRECIAGDFVHRHYSAKEMKRLLADANLDVEDVRVTASLISYGLGVVLNTPIPRRVKYGIRRLTGWLYDFDYSLKRQRGFCLCVVSRKPVVT